MVEKHGDLGKKTKKPQKGGKSALPQERVLQAVLEVIKKFARGLGAFQMMACMRCGLCADSCHVYLSERQTDNLPGWKAAKVSSLFRRYCTFAGRYFPRLVGARDLAPAMLDELSEAVFGRCTACGRCTIHCALGVDLRSILRAGRQICASSGRVPEGLQRVLDNQLQTGNQIALPRDELLSTAGWLSKDLQEEMGDPRVQIPIDEKGKRMLYVVNPREIKFLPLSLMTAAGIFHAAGESWTLSSRTYDVTNYGFFAGDTAAAAELARRVMEEAKNLAVEEIIISECGHGFQALRWEGPEWLGKKYSIPMRSIPELLDEYITGGRIRVDPNKNPAPVTLHDPCNLVRLGGVVEPQRRVLASAVRHFVEMTPNREENFCCGGGGGILSLNEFAQRRIISGRSKADQIRGSGAKIVAAPCHNCIDQIHDISKKYELGIEAITLVELVYNALVFSQKKEPQ